MKKKENKETQNENTTTLERQVLGSFKRSETEEIRVTRGEYKGATYIDIRNFFKDQSGEFRPTKKGITVKREHLSLLIIALQEAESNS